MVTHSGLGTMEELNEEILCTGDDRQCGAVKRILEAAGVDCRILAAGEGTAVAVDSVDFELAELVLAKRKKDVEEEEETDDEEEEEDDDDVGEDDDEDFDDDEDEFEEEFDDDELDDDDDDIFYDDDDEE